MTPDGVKPNSMCKREWTRALKYKKPVIPLRFDGDAELPFRLDPREYVDFADSFDVALAKLRNHLTWLDTPEGVLQALKVRLADAERELERPSGAPERTRIEQDIKELHRQIAEQEYLLADPGAARARAQEHIASGMEREREPDRPVTVRQAKFVNPPPVTAPAWFQNRHVETGQIGSFLRQDGRRLLTVVGRGGIGKTAMVCRLLKALEGGQLPDDYGPLEVDGIVYLSPVGAHKVTYPNLFADLTRLLPEARAQRLKQRYQDPRQTTAEQMLALLEAFPSGRSVLLLDNFEDVVDPETLAITDAALDEALRTLLTAPGHGIKVILTTRVAPKALLLVQPALQQRLNLDEGLESPYAEGLLRAMDPDGTLGLKTASDELLATARERTRGYPRALEALAAIMAADRDTSLPELLAETSKLLPDNVVQALVGEAFNRLDPLAQQVMQALAIYGLPVPPVAVDYLLLPSLVTIDSAPVLSRLVNMQFVRREAGRYYLHQVDRDYALSRVPAGEPADRDADPAPFTRQALWHRGAAYFKQTQTPREEWKTLDDLAPQLAEFELRYQGEDYDTAAQVLLGIGPEYLSQWGHYRLTAEMYERLQGHLEDPWTNAASKSELGECYRQFGEFTRAIDLQEEALAIARETGDRDVETGCLGGLGLCYWELGQIAQAIDLYEQALAIARERGNRDGEATLLGSLGSCYAELGQIARAIDLFEQALAIARETGDRPAEAILLGNLGNRYTQLGETARAIDLYEQALAIERRIGYRYGEAQHLACLGQAHGDLRMWGQGVEYCRQAMEIADAIGSARAQSAAYIFLAQIQLLAGDFPAARQAISGARAYDYPAVRAELSLLSGIIQLRQNQPMAAALEFRDAITQADELLQHTSGSYGALDTKALALSGLALTTDPGKAAEACEMFRAARAITSADGIVRWTLALFNAVAATDRGGILAGIRQAVAGRKN